MSRAEITLKSGAVVHFDTTELTVSKSPVTGTFSGLKWKTPDGPARALMHINIDEVAAVVFVDDDTEASATTGRYVDRTRDAAFEEARARWEAAETAEKAFRPADELADPRALADAAGRRYWNDAEFHARVMRAVQVADRGQPNDGFDRWDVGSLKMGAAVALHLDELQARLDHGITS